MPKKKYVKRPFPRKGVDWKKIKKMSPSAVCVCSACSTTLELYHMDFEAVKCINCDHVIQIEEIKESVYEN